MPNCYLKPIEEYIYFELLASYVFSMLLRKISPCLEILESYLSYPTQ